MDPERRWWRVKRLLHLALEREPESRQAFLDAACDGDTDLHHEVQLLLAKEDEAGSFLETPAMACATAQRTATLIRPGQQFGPYRIVGLLGTGGMGEVYRAHDGKLGRNIAIKTLPAEFAPDFDRLTRLRREARTLASLNHPNIAAIYGLESFGNVECLVLELVEGDMPRGPLSIHRAIDSARQVAEALEAAHQKGIIHRDLKPANVKVTPEGRVKVLDFGLAKAIWAPEGNQDLSPEAAITGAETLGGDILGTPGYMSPEQTRGQPVDERTDIWAFGCLLYELLSGRRAFSGDSYQETATAVLEREPDWYALPARTPARIRDLLHRCLQKDPNRRLHQIGAARIAIEKVQRGLNRRQVAAKLAICAGAVLLLLMFIGVRLYQHNSRVRWVREQVIPAVPGMLESADYKGAFRLLRRAEATLPHDPALEKLRREIFIPFSVRTNPPGAEVWAAEYDAQGDDWQRLGTTPLTRELLPNLYYRFRIVKAGFQTILGAGGVFAGPLEFDLDPDGTLPPDMVRVTGGVARIIGMDPAKVGAFLIDRYETTNKQFKKFIDSGGYRKPEYWTQDFVLNGRKLTWEEAMQLFRDSSGRPGPATWELGEYPQGQQDYPVSGVSWYEAAAYAEFAGKQLPTIYHWQRAASPDSYSDMTEASNFGAAGPARVGTYKGIGPFGTLDMAGNVKEWCWNQFGSQRYIRGGAWNEPQYMVAWPDTRPPWDRSPRMGSVVPAMTRARTPHRARRSPGPFAITAKRNPYRTKCSGCIAAFMPMILDSSMPGSKESTRRIPTGNERGSRLPQLTEMSGSLAISTYQNMQPRPIRRSCISRTWDRIGRRCNPMKYILSISSAIVAEPS